MSNSKDFDIKLIQDKNGPLIYIQQVNPYQNVILTPFEAEQLRNDLTKVITDARNVLNSKVRFKL